MASGARFSALTQQWTSWLHNLMWDTNLAAQPLWRRTGIRALQITYAVARDLAEGQLSLRAMSLVYYTVIAIIPLLALTFSVLKGLSVHNAMEPALLNVLQPLGERSLEVTRNIINFVENVRVDVLGVVSLGILLYTVHNMMQKIEMSFNFIWSVSVGRKFANRISEYLFAVIVSPLLIFVSIGISSYISTNLFERYLSGYTIGGFILQFIAFVTAFTFMSLAFAFTYKFVPNTKVKFKSALVGGVMTAVIWKTMGGIFQAFFINSTNNEVIYVAFFSVILVMIFAYLGWLVLLTGSSIAYYHQYPAKARTGRRKTWLSIAEQEGYALAVAYLIIQRFKQREAPWSAGALADHLRLNPSTIDEIITLLERIDFIRPTNEDPENYLPSGSVEDCTVAELRQKIRNYSPEFSGAGSTVAARVKIKEFISDTDKLIDNNMGTIKFVDLTRKVEKPENMPAEKSAD
ncbi:MAG: YihY/virulence factor BrkB family protein [Gammaproteobacteria bacterium]|nr:YihY/virulence factor BrkB family protein [Gammaproteobacteria bacterium]MDP2139320.1 YihY/virulence factor BrkB family protein [Gammaproteobacteria bacterium]MDP2346877.1 YihY/virulence factor BrkB family protein [Gammaproteobacteria bacterium]